MFDLFKSHTPKPAKGAPKASKDTPESAPKATAETQQDAAKAANNEGEKPAQADERGGPKGLEPTRYGDWERKGICYDF